VVVAGVHTRPGRPPVLLELPTGAPLGVGGVTFRDAPLDLAVDDELVLYTDGLVETRDHDIDTRLAALTDLLGRPRRSPEETCDLLLGGLRHRSGNDDIALLVARARALPRADGTARS
ncbi:SpoIIE family protein phosphatase, partial [Kitasatospora aureofaciens]|uniref:SpoIIE family protein phosphatase n=1 Tax=Kitasatospora aureofaciens TaxID=1894 RepID=UPI000AE76CE4